MTLKTFDKVAVGSYDVTVFRGEEFETCWTNDWEVEELKEVYKIRCIHHDNMEKYGKGKVRFVNYNKAAGRISVTVYMKEE